MKPVDLRARLFADEGGRHEIINRCREMYRTDPRAEGVLRMMARDATRSGFVISVNGTDAQSRRAREIAADTVTRLRLDKRLEDWIRLGARDGDLFLEPGIAAGGQIVEVTRKPTLNMVRLSDDFDRFADPAQAFAYVDARSAAAGLVDSRATYFPEFLMIHGRWNHDSESRYGTPEFASSRRAWKMLTEGELDLAIRRKTRAGIKYVHTLIGATEADIEAYKEINEEALADTFAAAADFFLNFEGGISTLDGDPHLGELADIGHHLQTWSASSAVPLELLAYGENLNRDVLEDKKRQYDETLGQVRQWAADQIIIPLMERAWLLAGILPETLDYSVNWPTSREIAPAELAALVSAVNGMRQSGWSDAAVAALVDPYLPDEIDRSALFDGPLPMPVDNSAALPAAEAVGAVNRLLGRLEMAAEPPDRAEFAARPGAGGAA